MLAAFVFNPTAQSGVAARRWDEIERLAAELEIAFERFETRPHGETATMARDLAASRRFDTIVAFGGDGTISEVASGMMAAREAAGMRRDELAALAVVPFGTGNNIAKSFNLQSTGPHLRKAVETIRYGADFRLDLGRVIKVGGTVRTYGAPGTWFADAFSIGVDPAILHERNVEREKAKRSPILRTILRDYNLYVYASLRVPMRHKNVAAKVYLDDREPIEVAHLTNLIVNNVRVYAAEFVFDPESRANDGLMDVIIFTGWRDYLSKFIVAARMSPINPRVLDKVLKRRSHVYQARRVRITTAREVDSQLDGEVYERAASFELECVADALTLKTPVG